MKAYGIHWFRRDLRLEGNPALLWNSVKNEGRVLGIFCFDKKFLARPDFSPRRFSFFLRTLEILRKQMREQGGDLLFLDQSPDESFPALLKEIPKPTAWSWNRDYEPFARDRDARIEELLSHQNQIEVHTERDHLLIEPNEIKPYQIFTPFQKTWLARAKEIVLPNLFKMPPGFEITWKDLKIPQNDLLEKYLKETPVDVELPEGGHAAALKRLRGFKITPYGEERDFPALDSTSKLSVYFKNGSITVPQVIQKLGLLEKPGKFLSELVWREFYYHALYHYPRVEHEPFHKKYADLKWDNDPEKFELWKEGRTGFPLVDAGMRELKQTGFMHNRVRMVVATFLVKDLLIDWRWGEKYFMQMLLDGDLAPNNGGWQWAASTGCDAQPYFRVFNPTLQAERFDPEEKYIRHYVPEYGTSKYPDPIVDHKIQSQKAIKLYKLAQ